MSTETPDRDSVILAIDTALAAWRPIALFVVMTALSTLGAMIVLGGLGRVWESQVRMGVEGGQDHSAALHDILRARIQSRDLARSLRFSPDIGVAVRGSAVLDILVTARDPGRAIAAANAIQDHLLVTQDEEIRQRWAKVSEARRAIEQRARGERQARDEYVRRELAVIDAQHAGLGEQIQQATQRVKELDRRLTGEIEAARVRAHEEREQAAKTRSGWIPGETPADRRLADLERERAHALSKTEREHERLMAQATRVEGARQQLLAPPPVAPSPVIADPAPPRLVLVQIERAVSATRLPLRVWVALPAASLLAAVLGALGAMLARWWREAHAASAERA